MISPVSRCALLLALPMLAACGDETVSGYALPGATWRLVEMHGAPVAWSASLSLPSRGTITGQGPCTRFSGAQSAVYPWFDAGPLRATGSTCPDSREDRDFRAGIEAARLAEVSGPILILTDGDGREMVFRAE